MTLSLPNAIDEADLVREFPFLSEERNDGESCDQFGSRLSRRRGKLTGRHALSLKNGSLPVRAAKPIDLWSCLRNEFFVLCCTDDVRYRKLRTEIQKLKGKSSVVIVGMISAAIASIVSIEIGIITPFIAILIKGALELSMNAWCAFQRERTV